MRMPGVDASDLLCLVALLLVVHGLQITLSAVERVLFVAFEEVHVIPGLGLGFYELGV